MTIIKYSDIPGTGHTQVLNYGLLLQNVETNMYQQAIMRLTTGGASFPRGPRIPGLSYPESARDVNYVGRLSQAEAQHRDFLSSTIGSQSYLGRATTTGLASAQFDFGFQDMTREQVLQSLYNMENLGIQSYLGMMNTISGAANFAAINAIQNAEARHAAVLAQINNSMGFSYINPAPLVGQTSTIYGVPNTIGIDGTLDANTVLSQVSPWFVF